MRQIAQDKLKIILELKGTPIILVACKKIGLPTSTFYRWQDQDKRFASEVKRAIKRGREDVSDIAEAHLVRAVKKGDSRSVFFWLKTFRGAYKKQEKTVFEVKQHQPTIQLTQRPGARKVLLPSTPVNEGPPVDSRFVKQFSHLAKGIFRKMLREEALMRELIVRGATQAEIEALLKDIKEF